MTNPTNTDLADALREIANTLPLGSALVVRLAADRLDPPARMAEECVDPDGWVEWNGGECPVRHGTPLTVKHRDGDIYHTVAGGAYNNDWSIDPIRQYKGDIVAYRIVK